MAVSSFPAAPKKSSSPFILIIGAVVIVGGIAYWYFQSQGAGPTLSLPGAESTSSVDPKIDEQVAEILHAVDTIKNLNLDTKFFDDKRFTALQETQVVIPDAKPDPFSKHPFQFVGEVPASGTSK